MVQINENTIQYNNRHNQQDMVELSGYSAQPVTPSRGSPLPLWRRILSDEIQIVSASLTIAWHHHLILGG